MKGHGQLACLAVLLLMFMGCGETQRPRLKALFIMDLGYGEADVRDLSKAFQTEIKHVDVLPFFMPYQSQHDAILGSAATEAQAYDVVAVEAIWATEFVEAKFLLDLSERLKGVPTTDIVPFASESFTVSGKRYALPWLADCEYLFYNKKMLKDAGFDSPPQTWNELHSQAATLRQKGIVTYPIVAQWGPREGIVCDFGCLLFARGGSFLGPKGPAFQEAPGLESLRSMKGLLDEELANPASLDAADDDARHVLSEGQAAFNLNWFYVYDFANDPARSKVAGQVGIALAPGDNATRSATVGRSFGLAIMSNSQMPDVAWRYIQFLASKENQAKYCKTALPAFRSLYEGPQLFGAHPEIGDVVRQQYGFVQNRPSVFYYPKFSAALRHGIRAVLKGTKPPEAALAEAATRVQEASQERPVYTR